MEPSFAFLETVIYKISHRYDWCHPVSKILHPPAYSLSPNEPSLVCSACAELMIDVLSSAFHLFERWSPLFFPHTAYLCQWALLTQLYFRTECFNEQPWPLAWHLATHLGQLSSEIFSVQALQSKTTDSTWTRLHGGGRVLLDLDLTNLLSGSIGAIPVFRICHRFSGTNTSLGAGLSLIHTHCSPTALCSSLFPGSLFVALSISSLAPVLLDE